MRFLCLVSFTLRRREKERRKEGRKERRIRRVKKRIIIRKERDREVEAQGYLPITNSK